VNWALVDATRGLRGVHNRDQHALIVLAHTLPHSRILCR
jgi:hypothetical protein